MTASGSARLSMAIAIFVVLMCVMIVLPIIMPGPEPVVRRHFSKTALEIRADLDRTFPCRFSRVYTDKAYRADAGCTGYFFVEPKGKSAPLESVTAFPLLEKSEEDGTHTKFETSSRYGKVVQHLFPRWPRADVWVTASIEHARRSDCPKIAHIDDTWIVVRRLVNNEAYHYAGLTITTDDSDIVLMRHLDEEMCDGPVIVEEIR